MSIELWSWLYTLMMFLISIGECIYMLQIDISIYWSVCFYWSAWSTGQCVPWVNVSIGGVVGTLLVQHHSDEGSTPTVCDEAPQGYWYYAMHGAWWTKRGSDWKRGHTVVTADTGVTWPCRLQRWRYNDGLWRKLSELFCSHWLFDSDSRSTSDVMFIILDNRKSTPIVQRWRFQEERETYSRDESISFKTCSGYTSAIVRDSTPSQYWL